MLDGADLVAASPIFYRQHKLLKTSLDNARPTALPAAPAFSSGDDISLDRLSLHGKAFARPAEAATAAAEPQQPSAALSGVWLNALAEVGALTSAPGETPAASPGDEGADPGRGRVQRMATSELPLF